MLVSPSLPLMMQSIQNIRLRFVLPVQVIDYKGSVVQSVPNMGVSCGILQKLVFGCGVAPCLNYSGCVKRSGEAGEIDRAFSPHVLFVAAYLGRCPGLVWFAPLGRLARVGMVWAVGVSVSALESSG